MQPFKQSHYFFEGQLRKKTGKLTAGEGLIHRHDPVDFRQVMLLLIS